ncbi:MAG: hypothetical protein KAS71_05150 [Bacteroidales bacterium]|nr:hypothetical protein [Bacteroidales bacterium]
MKTERILHTIAAIITIGNLLFVLINSTSLELEFSRNLSFSEYTIPLRITLMVILELSLASFFGYIMAKSILKLDGNLAMTILTVSTISMISAWITYFNIEFVLFGNAVLKGFWPNFGLFFLFLAAWGIGATFIDAHYLKYKCDNTHEFGDSSIPIGIQAGAFLLIYIGALI